MVFADRTVFRKKVKAAELPAFFHHIAELGLRDDELAFVCIGTDRSSGDSLGPLVGSMLEEAGYPHVIGTLAKPLDASNMVSRLSEVPAGKTIIAIDACLGQHSSVGSFQVANQPIEPAKAVGGRLPGVGDFGVAAIVNVDGGNKYSILQSTSLHLVMSMANQIVCAVQAAIPISGRSEDR